MRPPLAWSLRAPRLVAALLAASAARGCLEDPIEPVPDAATDAARDVATDIVRDATSDTASDTASDAVSDAASDAGTDVSVDAGTDVTSDAGADVTADAGAVDAAMDAARDAPRDATGDVGYFGPSRCAGSIFAICEDFEGDAGYNRDVWTPYASNGTLAVEATRAARGRRALHVHTSAPNVDGGAGANVGLRTVVGFPRARNTYFGRAFVWMAARAPTTHSTLFESGGRLGDAGAGDGALPPGLNVSQRVSIAGRQLASSYDTSPRPPATDYARRSATAMPLDRWACLEWHFKGDTNELHVWLDGAELTDMAVLPTRVPTWFAPDWVRVNVGLQLYRPDAEPEFDLWIDEVALHGTRVGCSR